MWAISITTRLLFGAFSVIVMVPVIPMSGISMVALAVRLVILSKAAWPPIAVTYFSST